MTLNIIDVDLELGIDKLRAYAKRLPRGTITLRVERYGGITLNCQVNADPFTEDDLDRMMREKPHKEKAHADA